jgi:beta-mannan synthase
MHAGRHALRAAGDAFFFRASDDRLSFSPAIAAAVEWWVHAWGTVRAELLVPLVRAAVLICMVMSVIVLAEKVFLGAVSSVVKLLRRRPGRVYRCDPIASRPDEEADGSEAYPMVLVQIPMYNEKEVRRWRLSVCPDSANTSSQQDQLFLATSDSCSE